MSNQEKHMVSILVLVYVWCMTSTKDNKGTQKSSTLNNSGSDQTILQKKCESEHSIDNECHNHECIRSKLKRKRGLC